MKARTINDLELGPYTLTLNLRRGEVLKRVKGEVVESENGRQFIANCSPKRSFAPNTQVLRRRKRRAVAK